MQDPILKLCTETPVPNVRNFCILAHVDHGKTTIADHLLTTNGLLSSQLAGQVRYLDSRPDEQERLITMKASSVALCHKLEQEKIDMFKALEKAAEERAAAQLLREQEEANQGESQKKQKEDIPTPHVLPFEKIQTKEGTFVCNLLDCPGHIDFSSEVAAAVRLCDGAVIVVDLVDGVTMVTRAMLRQCYVEGLPVVLLLNKLDYIILKMKLTPEEGFARMQAAVSECNAFLASCVNAEDIAAAGMTGNGASSAALDDDVSSNSDDDEDDSDDEQQGQENVPVNNTNTAIPLQHRALEVPADEIWFCPTKGNVVFASGLHGFGFQLSDFAALYKSKLPKVSTIELTRGLWGEHFLDVKTMTIQNKAKKEGTPCLGLTLFCEPLWKLHTEFEVRELDEEKIREMLSKIGLNPKPGFFKTNAHYIQSAAQRYGAEGVHLPKLFQLLGDWMPLSRTLLDAICCQLPCPLESQRRRAPVLIPESIKLLYPSYLSQNNDNNNNTLSESDQLLSTAVQVLGACSRSETAPLYAFVAKLLDVQYLAGVLPGVNDSGSYSGNNSSLDAFGVSHRQSKKHNAERGQGNDGFDLDQYFVALTRVYSGRLKAGQNICVDKGGKPTLCKVQEVYILRGQGLESVPYVAAGNICAIRGCSKDIIKCGTICEGDLLTVPQEEDTGDENNNNNNDNDDAEGTSPKVGEEAFRKEFEKHKVPEPVVRNRLPFITPIKLLSSSVVQLAVTPQFPDELGALLKGLKFLHQTDPQVELAVLPSGDHVIRCAGEVHAERCIEDLRTTFARVNLCVTDPIVGLRETVDHVTKITTSSSSSSSKKKSSSQNQNSNHSNVVNISLGGNDLQISVAAISLPSDILEVLMQNATEDHGSAPQTAQKVIRMMKSAKHLNRRRSSWKRMFRVQNAKIVAWGPQKMNFCGNLLIDTTNSFPADSDVEDYMSGKTTLNVVQEAIVSGFEFGTSRGPMADEPMFGIAFVITKVSDSLTSLLATYQQLLGHEHQQRQDNASMMHVNLPEGVFTGHIVSSVAQGCRQCFQANAGKQRIVEPVYECLVYSAGQTRGKIYSLLHRRRASIGEEILQEGTDMFSIKSYIPATESFGLQDELRTLTSGAATAQLRVDHWEVLDVDPYYKPTTREELEEQGTNVDKPNLAMTIIEQVRKRKGLYREQVVKHAEKQKFSMRGA